MANWKIIKSAARGFEGFGQFLGVVAEGDDYAALGCEAMKLEYEAIGQLHGGKKIVFDVHHVRDGVVDQASFDAYWLAKSRQPVVNVYD